MAHSAGARAMACVMGDMDLVRPLGLAGVPCAVVADPGSSVAYSRFTRETLSWDGAAACPDGYLDKLVRFGAGKPEKPVLYYEEDAHLLLVSRRRDRLSTAFRFVVAAQDLVEDLVDKARFQRLAERLDLPVPPTRRIHPAGTSIPGTMDLRFPIIVKPLTRCPAWDALEAGKALQVDSLTALQAQWSRLASTGLELLAQEMVPGPEARIESYHVYVDERGSVAGDFTGRKIRTHPRRFGHSTALTITDEADVAALGRAVIERIGLKGVAKLDFKRAPDGRLHLLEINARFTLWHHLGAVAGVNLPALVHADLTGEARPAVRRPRTGATWCHIAKDRLAAREAGVPALAWLGWMLRCDAKSLVWDDPMPFLRNTLSRITRSGKGGPVGSARGWGRS